MSSTLSTLLISTIVEEAGSPDPKWESSPYLIWKNKDPKTKGSIGEKIVSQVIGVKMRGAFEKGGKDLVNGDEIKTIFESKQGKFVVNRLKTDCDNIYFVLVQPDSVNIFKTTLIKLLATGAFKQQGRGNSDLMGTLTFNQISSISTHVSSC